MTRAAAGAMLAIVLLASVPAAAAFEIVTARVYIEQGQLLVDAEIDYAFSAEALEALSNGVQLTVVVEARLQRQRTLLWDELVAERRVYYRLQYHALANRYVLQYPPPGASQTYRRLAPLVDDMGRISALSLSALDALDRQASYRISLQARLDIESLPAPLRPLAHLSEPWQLNSGWHDWTWHWED